VNPIELGELSPGIELPLTPQQGRLLAGSGVVSATPSPHVPGLWQLAPAGKVGAARIGDIEIHIKPKVPISRLLFLVGYSQNGAAWRPEAVSLAHAADLIPAIAQALWRQTQRAVHQGLLPGYILIEESSQVLRGRLCESEQLHRHHGLPLPLEIRHDEFTVDIPENQILQTACERVLAVPRVDRESQRMLRRLLRDFTDVTPMSRSDPAPVWHPTRLNARYHTALRLAEIVLRATSVEHEYGAADANGFLLDMPRLFEDFVTVALREQLVMAYGGRVEDQDRSHFDEAGHVVLKPDIVWKIRGSPVAVVDAKYKSEKPAGYPNADLYQLLAYCTVLGLRTGHLIYAKGNEDPARHVVRRSGIEIICHAVDLDQPPDRLLAQMSDLAECIAATQLRPSANAYRAAGRCGQSHPPVRAHSRRAGTDPRRKPS
jgi:5-methylcytosine-specific restriction enzyme subunit McrC